MCVRVGVAAAPLTLRPRDPERVCDPGGVLLGDRDARAVRGGVCDARALRVRDTVGGTDADTVPVGPDVALWCRLMFDGL